MREAAADLQGGSQDHRRGGIETSGERGNAKENEGAQGQPRDESLPPPSRPDGTKRRQMMIDEGRSGHGRRNWCHCTSVYSTPITLKTHPSIHSSSARPFNKTGRDHHITTTPHYTNHATPHSTCTRRAKYRLHRGEVVCI